jgi:hypothetical protein
MATLHFSGDQVAFFGTIDDYGKGSTTFGGVEAPFKATDRVEIEIADSSVQGNGDFSPVQVTFLRVTVIRDGVRHDFGVGPDARIKETGGSEIKEQGDTFFTTNDKVSPPDSGPFAGVGGGQMVFSTTATFATGTLTTIDRTQAQDFNGDGDTADPGEAARAQFNVTPALDPPCFCAGTRILTPLGDRAVESLRPGDLLCLADGTKADLLLTLVRRRGFGAGPHPHRPVCIPRGALGADLPLRPLRLSPQHGLAAGPLGPPALAPAGTALVRAKALCGLVPGVAQDGATTEATYFALVLRRHATIVAEGVASESFYPGPVALRGLTGRDRAALDRVLPGVLADPVGRYGPRFLPAQAVGETRRRLATAQPRLREAAP